MLKKVCTTLAAASLATTAQAKAPPAHPQAEAQALELAKQTIAVRSVAGPDNRTIDVARLVKSALAAGGWADSDVEVVPFENLAYLIATWRGSDPTLKPLVISGHMDVVEAKREDWVRDPFVPVIENGFLFGRGATDMKVDNALAVASLIELRRSGYRPRRSIIVAFSGDEETTMASSQRIAERLAESDLVLNIDMDYNGVLDEKTGKPVYWSWQGAEKGYADFELTVLNPGGHSSTPRADNAINQLSAALLRIGAYRFPSELNELTKAHFEQGGAIETDPEMAKAMRAFAANPRDPAALKVLQADPSTVGKVGTTCVVTTIAGGHAINALPQRASANVNCRIFPGHTRAEVMAELQRVAADPEVKFRDVTEGATDSPASPMRRDFLKAASKAIRISYPGIPVIPAMSLGASDCMWYRARGVPCYIASPLFLKPSDNFNHGLNERVPIANIRPAINYYLSVLKDLSL